jgi:hypothetical protein
MGKLKPGATYIYERVNQTVYQREAGSSTREEVGWEYDPVEPQQLRDQIKDRQLWRDILQSSKNNATLRQAIEQVKLIYELSRNHEKK